WQQPVQLVARLADRLADLTRERGGGRLQPRPQCSAKKLNESQALAQRRGRPRGQRGTRSARLARHRGVIVGAALGDDGAGGWIVDRQCGHRCVREGLYTVAGTLRVARAAFKKSRSNGASSKFTGSPG